MEQLFITMIVFFAIYFLYWFTVIKNKQKMEAFEKSGQGSFIIKKYHLDVKKIKKEKFAKTIALTNSLIITITFFITDFFPNYILKLLIGFIILIPLILLGYHIVGSYYKKKEVNKNV